MGEMSGESMFLSGFCEDEPRKRNQPRENSRLICVVRAIEDRRDWLTCQLSPSATSWQQAWLAWRPAWQRVSPWRTSWSSPGRPSPGQLWSSSRSWSWQRPYPWLLLVIGHPFPWKVVSLWYPQERSNAISRQSDGVDSPCSKTYHTIVPSTFMGLRRMSQAEILILTHFVAITSVATEGEPALSR